MASKVIKHRSDLVTPLLKTHPSLPIALQIKSLLMVLPYLRPFLVWALLSLHEILGFCPNLYVHVCAYMCLHVMCCALPAGKVLP